MNGNAMPPSDLFDDYDPEDEIEDNDLEFDDDGDDDDEPADGESFDGGFGPGSYFSRAMQKDD
jgi:hypothetical protein